MTSIAVLGATSQIAKDYIVSALGAGHDLHLFSRRSEEVAAWVSTLPEAKGKSQSLAYDAFGRETYTAIINFVGSGDPARTAKMGGEIFEVTAFYDRLACQAVERNPSTRYIFLSSGAAYGATFIEPAGPETQARISINAFTAQEYYSVAKLYAEATHRAMPDLPIVDIRIFGYFSRTADPQARFFLTDIARAIRDGAELETGSATMWRDYIGPDDFFGLVQTMLDAPANNVAVDSYSKAPVEKFEMLEAFRAAFGLQYRITQSPPQLLATGAKPMYYSNNHKAAEYGYAPCYSALECVTGEMRLLLDSLR